MKLLSGIILCVLGWVQCVALAVAGNDDLSNTVVFRVGNGNSYSLFNGGAVIYTIEGLSVHSGNTTVEEGQPYISDLVYADGDTTTTSLTFTAKRTNDDDPGPTDKSVRKWLNGVFDSDWNWGSNTTFNHSASRLQNIEKLNFAFVGTLSLRISGGSIKNGDNDSFDNYRFEKIVLAQGKDNGNNWWFGGVNCKHIGSNRVACDGVDSLDNPVTFIFWRGDNGDNGIIDIEPTFPWMNRLSDKMKLNRIIMPGSHDAGMSTLSDCTVPGIEAITQTQQVSILGQLARGSRYFDIRLDDYPPESNASELIAHHHSHIHPLGFGLGWHGCNGQRFSDMLEEAMAYVARYPTETAIFKISHLRDDGARDVAAMKWRIQEMVKEKLLLDGWFKYGRLGIYFPNSNNIAYDALGQVETAEGARGKVIVVYDYPQDFSGADPSGEDGQLRYRDAYNKDSNGTDGKGICVRPTLLNNETAHLSVCDNYTNSDKKAKMIPGQLNQWRLAVGTRSVNKDYLYLMSWTLTPQLSIKFSLDDFTTKNISKLANGANAALRHEEGLSSMLKEHRPMPNIIYLDFVDSLTTEAIIHANWPAD